MSESATTDLNSKHRREQLAAAFSEYDKLQQEKKELGAAQTDITKRLKEDLGISPAAFRNAYKLWQMDQPDRDAMFDAMRECFDALGIGEQASFLDALEGMRSKLREDGATATLHVPGLDPVKIA